MSCACPCPHVFFSSNFPERTAARCKGCRGALALQRSMDPYPSRHGHSCKWLNSASAGLRITQARLQAKALARCECMCGVRSVYATRQNAIQCITISSKGRMHMRRRWRAELIAAPFQTVWRAPILTRSRCWDLSALKAPHTAHSKACQSRNRSLGKNGHVGCAKRPPSITLCNVLARQQGYHEMFKRLFTCSLCSQLAGMTNSDGQPAVT